MMLPGESARYEGRYRSREAAGRLLLCRGRYVEDDRADGERARDTRAAFRNSAHGDPDEDHVECDGNGRGYL